MIHQSSDKLKKFWLVLSVGINLGFLAFFKYYNFFIESFAELLQNFGFNANITTLNLIMPVGISFYTFHGLSYVFDIYNKRVEPTKNFVQYSLFVSYFPLLVAGPIERATHLLPQVKVLRTFKYRVAIDGLRQFLWGLIKKVVIADNCAEYANLIFNNSDHYSGLTLLLGAVLFAFQIYGDFSGYTDMALGVSRLFGIELLKNFNYPYFSRNISEFWRRWHISLSSWFRDYLYIPLGGSRVSTLLKIRNTFIIFIVSGFWHGANWTFIFWGALNALFIVPTILVKEKKPMTSVVAEGRLLPSLKEFFQVVFTFLITVFAWIFFRAESLSHAFRYISDMFSFEYRGISSDPEIKKSLICIVLILPFLMLEWIGREQNYALETLGAKWPRFIRWSFYSLLIFLVGIFMSVAGEKFIYFQF